MGKEGEALRLETTTSFFQSEGEAFDSYLALGQNNISVWGDRMSAFEEGQDLVLGHACRRRLDGFNGRPSRR